MTSLKLPISHQLSKMLINIYLHWTFNYIGIFWLLLVNSCSNLQNHTWVPVTWTSIWVSLAVGHIALRCPEPAGGNCCALELSRLNFTLSFWTLFNVHYLLIVGEGVLIYWLKCPLLIKSFHQNDPRPTTMHVIFPLI